MSRKKTEQPPQESLFAASPLTCPGMENIPLILDSHVSAIEVLAPGSVYQPLLLEPKQDHIDAGPGTLDEHEEAFVRDLIRFLYPAGNHPKSEKTPLRWDRKEVWLKRNIEKRDDSFRLRVDDSDWFYPDFIVWIIDHDARIQTFGFVDPKGLTVGAGGGWSDYKIVSTLFMPHVVEQQLSASGQKVEYEGEEWTFRVRGVLVSTSAFESLTAQAKFNVRDDMGHDVSPSEDDFRRGRIVFQRNNTTYIEEVLRLLTEDTIIDSLLNVSARLIDGDTGYVPKGEQEHDLALRRHETQQIETDFVAALLRDYLRPSTSGEHGDWVTKNRRRLLMEYAKEGKWGIGAEKAVDILNHPTPCEELWKRIQKSKGA